MADFQSWSQGVGVFGKKRMLKLWSAANVKLYAEGVAEGEFLRTLSELIGTYDKETTLSPGDQREPREPRLGVISRLAVDRLTP